MLKLENISKTYHEELFGHINLILGKKEKVGLVGLNGCGKSTLLKIITGELEPSTGHVALVQERLGYLPQQFDITHDGQYQLLGEYMESLVGDIHSELWKVEKMLGKLRFGEVDQFASLGTLSPGQIMKLYLVKLMMEDPTILLLDEPTNHLDITGIEWLETFIKGFEGIAIIISHDREFLNQVTSHILELDEKRLHVYEGNYDEFVVEKQKRLDERSKQFRLQEGRRQKIESMIQLAKKQGGGRKQAKKLSSARKRLEREVKSSEIDQYTKQEMKNLAISGSVHSRKLILELDDIAFGYAGGENLLEHLSLEVYGSETLWLYGPNGTGKSTLLKIITGELEPDSGTVRWGKDVRWSYFAQDQTNMATETTVQEYFHDQTDVVWEKSYGALQRFMFDKSLRNRRVMDLSPGQKARLTFAIFAQKELECLILDEPTNHLDIETKESIEVALREYQGVIILVSHDRYFAEQMKPDRVLTIQNKGLKAEPGFLLE